MIKGYFSIGEKVIVQDRDDGKKYEGIISDVTYTSDLGTWYLVGYNVDDKEQVRTFHGFDLERIDD